MDKRRIRATVRGQVQGVSFRAATQDEARRLGVTGWVRNLVDGGVLVEAQGPSAAVDALVAWCHHGPPLADVATVEVAAIELVGDDRGFDVHH